MFSWQIYKQIMIISTTEICNQYENLTEIILKDVTILMSITFFCKLSNYQQVTSFMTVETN